MKKVTKYLSDNGKLYDTEEEAYFRDEVHKLSITLENNHVVCRDDPESIAEFLLQNFTLTPKNK